MAASITVCRASSELSTRMTRILASLVSRKASGAFRSTTIRVTDRVQDAFLAIELPTQALARKKLALTIENAPQKLRTKARKVRRRCCFPPRFGELAAAVEGLGKDAVPKSSSAKSVATGSCCSVLSSPACDTAPACLPKQSSSEAGLSCSDLLGRRALGRTLLLGVFRARSARVSCSPSCVACTLASNIHAPSLKFRETLQGAQNSKTLFQPLGLQDADRNAAAQERFKRINAAYALLQELWQQTPRHEPAMRRKA